MDILKMAKECLDSIAKKRADKMKRKKDEDFMDAPRFKNAKKQIEKNDKKKKGKKMPVLGVRG